MRRAGTEISLEKPWVSDNLPSNWRPSASGATGHLMFLILGIPQPPCGISAQSFPCRQIWLRALCVQLFAWGQICISCIYNPQEHLWLNIFLIQNFSHNLNFYSVLSPLQKEYICAQLDIVLVKFCYFSFLIFINFNNEIIYMLLSCFSFDVTRTGRKESLYLANCSLKIIFYSLLCMANYL